MADELVEVFHLLAEGNGVGRVLGVRPGGEDSCDVELLTIWRIGDDYRLRSALVGLDRLPSARGHLFTYPPPARLPFEDIRFSTLTEALTGAGFLVRASRADPIPGHGAWLKRSEFLDGLTRAALRSKISWLPEPPHWWDVTRKVLTRSGTVVTVVLPAVITWWAVSQIDWWDWGEDWAFLLAFAVWVVLSVLLSLLSEPSEWILDRVERRIERDRDAPGSLASDVVAPSTEQEHPASATGVIDGAEEVGGSRSPADSPMTTDSAVVAATGFNGGGGSQPMIQVVEVRPQPLRAADLDLVVVMPAPEGFTLRWLSCAASDLPAVLPCLFDPDPQALVGIGDVADQPRVADQAFVTVDDAKVAACWSHSAVDPDGWVDGELFRTTIEHDAQFTAWLRPEAQRVGARGRVTVGIACVAVFGMAMYAGYRVNVWVGLDTPEMKDTPPDQVFVLVTMMLASAVTVWAGIHLHQALARRNLAVASAGPPRRSGETRPERGARDGAAHDLQWEAAPPVAGPASSPVQDVPAATARQDVPGSTSPQEVRDALLPPPDALRVRPTTGRWWFAGWLGGSLLFVLPALSPTDLPETGMWPFIGLGLTCVGVGTLGLRMGLVADSDAVTVNNLFSRARIRWSELDDILLADPGPKSQSTFLIFVTRQGRRVGASEATDLENPEDLNALRLTLLAMRDHHRARP